jgi:hypothetical protein
MEKVRVILAALKKHLFWVLCGILVVVCLTTWLMATSQLSAKFEARGRQLNSRFNEVRSTITDNHPNEDGIKRISELHEKLGDNVFEAWSYLYEEQRRQNPLPAVVKQMEGFEQEFEKRWGPLEKLDPNNEMDLKYRERYANQITKHFPMLTDTIDRRYVPEEGGTGSKVSPHGTPSGKGAAAAAQPVNAVGTVWWEDSDLGKTEERFTRWKAIPSTLEVLLAQEDLWVYEALLRVIRNTNSTSADPDNYVKPASHKMAAVKRIMAMQIGQDAVASWQASEESVIRLPAAARAGGGSGAGMAPPGGPAALHSGHAPAMGPGGPRAAAAGSARPGALAGRYVDDQGKPLTDPTQQPYAEFRMMPINLRVVIEQNQIPKLLAECANSNMPIEVRKFRLLTAEFPAFEPEGGGAAAAGPATAGGGPKGGGHAGGPGVFHPRAAGGGAGPRGKTETPTGEQEDECINPMEPAVPVEVQGIIYIYNPPDRQNLGKGTAGGAVAPSGPAAAGPAIPVGPSTAPPPGPATGEPKPPIAPAPGPAPVPGPGKPGPAAPVLPGPGVSPAPPPPAAPAPAPPDAPPAGKPPAGGPAVPPPRPVAPKGGPA